MIIATSTTLVNVKTDHPLHRNVECHLHAEYCLGSRFSLMMMAMMIIRSQEGDDGEQEYGSEVHQRRHGSAW